jgi:chromosome segregation ATPase
VTSVPEETEEGRKRGFLGGAYKDMMDGVTLDDAPESEVVDETPKVDYDALLVDLRDELATVNSQKEELENQKSLYEEQIEEATRNRQADSKTIEGLEDKLRDVSERLANLIKENERLEQEIDGPDGLEAYKIKIRELENNQKTLEEEKKKLEKEQEQLISNYEELQAKAKEADALCIEKETQIKALEASISSEYIKRDKLAEKYVPKDKIGKGQEYVPSDELANLEDRIEELTEEAEYLKKQADQTKELMQERRDLRSQLRGLKKLEEEKARLNTQLSEVQEQLESKSQRLEEVESKYHEDKAMLSRYDNEIQLRVKELAEKGEELKEYKNRIEDLTDKYTEADHQVKLLTLRIEEVEEEKFKAEDKLNSLKDMDGQSRSHLEVQVSDYEVELKSLKRELERYKELEKNLQKENQKIKKSFSHIYDEGTKTIDSFEQAAEMWRDKYYGLKEDMEGRNVG